MLCDLKPVDALRQILKRASRLRQKRAFLDERCYNALDQRDLGILETLKPPTVELQAKSTAFCFKAHLNHFQNAGLAGPPIPMDANRHGTIRPIAEKAHDRSRDCFIV